MGSITEAYFSVTHGVWRAYVADMAAGRITEQDVVHSAPAAATWESMAPEARQTLLDWVNAPRWPWSRAARVRDTRFALASYGSQVEPPSAISNVADIVVALNLMT